MTIPGSGPDDRSIVIVEEPGDLVSIAVKFGRYVILLPQPGQGADFYSKIDTYVRRAGPSGGIAGRVIAWPTFPSFALDH